MNTTKNCESLIFAEKKTKVTVPGAPELQVVAAVDREKKAATLIVESRGGCPFGTLIPEGIVAIESDLSALALALGMSEAALEASSHLLPEPVRRRVVNLCVSRTELIVGAPTTASDEDGDSVGTFFFPSRL